MKWQSRFDVKGAWHIEASRILASSCILWRWIERRGFLRSGEQNRGIGEVLTMEKCLDCKLEICGWVLVFMLLHYMYSISFSLSARQIPRDIRFGICHKLPYLMWNKKP